ncbi:MAG: hypothetical protein S4CHLAM7_07720 [Chlamydiae bacterium]|nr:hypothetical protein [Chlamydiota bacterium]
MPLVFRKWSIQKKLHVSLLSLVVILGLNAVLTSIEIRRLKEAHQNLSYLIYLDLLGILAGCLFIWIISKSVIRPMKKMIKQIESKMDVEAVNLYGTDEIGELARAVNMMKKTHSHTGEMLEEKKQLIEAILNHSVDTIFMFNLRGDILSHSQSFRNTFGYQEEDEKGDLSLILPHIELEDVSKQFKGQSPRLEFYTKEFVAKKVHTKKNFKIQCSICPISGQKEDLYVGIIRNLQKRKRIKHFLKKCLLK